MSNGTPGAWTRNIDGIDGELAATYDSQTGTATLQLTNLHGDVVATASTSGSATAPLQTFESDEFGNPKQTGNHRYGWLGGKGRRTELASGVVQMGVREYVPAMGRFTSTDPVAGGSANDYDYTNADPVNGSDLGGQYSCRVEAHKKFLYSYQNSKGEQKTRTRIHAVARCRGFDLLSMRTEMNVTRHVSILPDPHVYKHPRRDCENSEMENGVLDCGIADYWSCRVGHTYNLNVTVTVSYMGLDNTEEGGLREVHDTFSRKLRFKCIQPEIHN
jgi:RHS repeat-associated protein